MDLKKNFHKILILKQCYFLKLLFRVGNNLPFMYVPNNNVDDMIYTFDVEEVLRRRSE